MSVTVYSAIGAVGYGIPETSIDQAQEKFDIDVITADGGSIDVGPNYLGRGIPSSSWNSIERDLELLLELQQDEGVPLLIGSCLTTGSKDTLDKTVSIVKRIVDEKGYSPNICKIYSDLGTQYLSEKVEAEDFRKLDFDKEISLEDVRRSEKTVGQMGIEPYIEALGNGADIVLAGRSVDVAPMAAYPIMEGFDKGLAVHMGKIIECGAMAATPSSGSDSLIGIIDDDYFDVVPPNPDRRCTVQTVSEHVLYEKADPYHIHAPGIRVDVKGAEYTQIDRDRVRVSGTSFVDTDYSVLVEGVERAGFQSIIPGGVKGPKIAEKIDDVFDEVRDDVSDQLAIEEERYTIILRRYGGGSGVLLEGEQKSLNINNELGIIIDVVGETEGVVQDVISRVQSELLHRDFEGRYATAGNIAFPYSPAIVSIGERYEFSIHHLLTGITPLEITDTHHLSGDGGGGPL